MPSSRATSSSAGVISTDFKKPSTSVNHRRTNRTPRSSTVRRTYSSWRSIRLLYGRGTRFLRPGGAVTERSHSGNGRETAPQKTRDRQPNPVAPQGDDSAATGWERSVESTHRRGVAVIKAEYIWIDGTEPTARLRSKTKVLPNDKDLSIWGFDGSSTNQAPGSNSDCVLRPVFSCPDPARGGDHLLVMA